MKNMCSYTTLRLHCPRAEQFICLTLIGSESREGLLGRAVALWSRRILEPFPKQRFQGASDQRFRTMFTPKVSKELRLVGFWEMEVYHEILWNIFVWTTWMVSPETSVKTKGETREVIVQLALEMIPPFQDSCQKDEIFTF